MSSHDRASGDLRFEALYDSTAKDLLAFVARRASDPEEAADILAEVYIVAWRRLDKLPTGDEARLWLFGVARNLLIKSSQRRRSHEVLVHDLTIELTRRPPYQSETTDGGLDDMMRASLQKLPAKQREVLLLTAWEGLKPREIAKVTGSTANVVRVRLHHARQRLARELRPARPSPERDEPASEPIPHLRTML